MEEVKIEDEFDDGTPLPQEEEQRVEGEQLRGRRRTSRRNAAGVRGPFSSPRRRSNSVDADGDWEMEDEEPQAGRWMNAPALPTPPVYSGCTMVERRAFIRAYESYYRQCWVLSTVHSKPYVMPIGACIEDQTLKEILTFELMRDASTMTEEDWSKYFREAKELESEDYEPMDRALAKMRMNVRLPDAVSRVGRLRKDLMTILDEHNMEHVLTTGPKKLVSALVSALAPPPFKEQVRKKLELDKYRELKRDVVKFLQWLTQLLTEYVRWEPALEATNPPDGRPSKGARGDRRGSSSGGRNGNGDRTGKNTDTQRGSGGGTGGDDIATGRPRTERKPHQQRGMCLKCSSPTHRVRDCSEVAEGEAERLLAAWRERRKSDGGVRTRALVPVKTTTAMDPGLCSAKIEGCIEVKETLLDTGSEVSLVSKGLLDILRTKVEFLALSDSGKQLTLLPVGSERIVVTRRLKLGRVQLESSAGPVVVKEMICWIHEQDERVSLTIGRPVMEQLGYSVDKLLATAKEKQEEYQMCEVPEEESTVARACQLRHAQLYEDASLSGFDNHDERTTLPDVAKDDNGTVRRKLSELVNQAVEKGLPAAEATRLSELLVRFEDVFRLQFGKDPPVKIEPLRVRLKPGAQPVKCSSRRYPPLHREFLEKHVSELERYGLVYVNQRSRWCSAPRIVSKKEADQFRMTVDTRGVNARTEPMPWPMPHLEVVITYTSGARVYFLLDWFRGYWQLPLHKESQEYYTIMTSRGMVTPTRVLMGCTDAVAYCQGAVEEIFQDLLYKGILAWLDDILGYAKTATELLDILEKVLMACEKYGLKLHPGKCQFYVHEAVWCGKQISARGVEHCKSRVQGLCDMSPPTNAGELQQFVCALNWMRASIPRYNQLVAPLTQLLEEAMKTCKSRKKNQLMRVPLDECRWNVTHSKCLEECKQALLAMIPLAHPKDENIVCLYTDASVDFWGAVATQIPSDDLVKPRDEQRHEPLAFLSGSFVGAASRWPIVEKEAYAIVEACRRLEYILLRPAGFRLYTDHRNLVYMFHPEATDTNMARYQADKLQRWAMTMTSYRYVVEHVTGDENVWGDLLSRWGAAEQRGPREARVHALAVLPVSPLQCADFQWPSLEEVARVQEEAMTEAAARPLTKNPANMCLVDEVGKVWIPESALDLQQRLLVVAHAGVGGHRGIEATTSAVRTLFTWKTLDADVRAFLSACLHCMRVAGTVEPRPYGPTLHATKPNELLHFDYLDLPQDMENGGKYVIVLKDGMSGYVELIPQDSHTAENAADALLGWFSRYGVVATWMSDQGSHFKNELMAKLKKKLGGHHHFVTAYCSWASGSIEVVNRLVLRSLRAIMSELKLVPSQWRSVLPLVQAALNHQPADRLGGIAPVTAFLALPATKPLDALVHPKTQKVVSIDMLRGVHQQHMAEIAAALDQMHRDVVDASETRRIQARGRRALKKGVKAARFSIGDFVLVGLVEKHVNKLAIQWRGPRRIVAAHNDYTFEVQDLLPPYDVKKQHASRLRLYAESGREVTEDLKDHIRHSEGGYLVEKFVDIRKFKSDYQLQVKWYGLDDVENTWENVVTLQEDVPKYFARYCKDNKNVKLVQDMVKALARRTKTQK